MPSFPRRLLGLCLYTAFLAVLTLAEYECVAHSPDLWGAPWPGWQETVQADRRTPWRPRTGVRVLDCALHEGAEAARWYAALLGGSGDVPPAPLLDVRQQG